MPMATPGIWSPSSAFHIPVASRYEKHRYNHREPVEEHPDASAASSVAGGDLPTGAVSDESASHHTRHHQDAPQHPENPRAALREFGCQRQDGVLRADSHRGYRGPKEHYSRRSGDVHGAPRPVHRLVDVAPALFGCARPRLTVRYVHRAPPCRHVSIGMETNAFDSAYVRKILYCKVVCIAT